MLYCVRVSKTIKHLNFNLYSINIMLIIKFGPPKAYLTEEKALNLGLKFIYSAKATKFCEIFTLLLSYVVSVKIEMKILQNFVAFSS
jgi:hypothetical protein